MLSLDEAIKHCDEVAEKHERHLKVYENMDEDRPLFKKEEIECRECAQDHRQLAEWLKKLKAYEEAKEKIELKAENCPQDEIRYGMRSALYVLEKCLKEANAEGSGGE